MRQPALLRAGGMALLLLAVGLLVGVIATRGEPPAPVVAAEVACPPTPGKLSINGSTALYPAINEIAQLYLKACPAQNIQVSASSPAFVSLCLDLLESKTAYSTKAKERKMEQRKMLLSLIKHHCGATS